MLLPPGVAMSMWHCSNAIRLRKRDLVPSWMRMRGIWSTPSWNLMSQKRSVFRRRHRMPASRSSDTQWTNCCRRLSATRRSPDHFLSHSRAGGGGVGCSPARRRLRRNTSRQWSIGPDSGSNSNAAAAGEAPMEDSSLDRSLRSSGSSVGMSGSKKRTARPATAPVCSGLPSWRPSRRSSTNRGIWFSSRIMSLRMACIAPRMAKMGSCREYPRSSPNPFPPSCAPRKSSSTKVPSSTRHSTSSFPCIPATRPS
ncbi:Os04g0505500 [Oryza sativa Japonica Group]|uniref:Os04g0505500 protein n=1 Tax=Oryza sativa subsp. japonica TaxID=39947 RepID=A0A0N7KJB8_ORYSJ|nr:hypothetical protein EE612_024276 [Oryza sativa]BAS89977.1 Os04g0505500 [Oryza sativa Japonica Group]